MNQPLSIDIDLFEDFLEERWHEDAKCELVHKRFSCTIDVVAIRETCMGDVLICIAGVEASKEWMAAGHARCHHCKAILAECWSLRAA